MKYLKLTSMLFITLLLFNSCKKNEVKDNCGCNGVIKHTIPDDKPLLGRIFFQEEAGQDTTGEFSFKFHITYTEKHCVNCVHSFTICNEELIPQELKTEILSGGVEDSVYFSGDVTETCEKIFAPAEYAYNHIILTKIEKK